MPLASRSSASEPFTDCDRMVEAAWTAASAAAARTSASAWASASAILPSAVLVRRATKSSILVLASAAMRSASARALATISPASRSAVARRVLYSASTLAASSLRRRASSSSALMRSARWSSAVKTVRWMPSHANTPIRMMNAIATQVSGSNIRLSLQGSIDGPRDRLAVGSRAGEPLHDRTGRVRRDATDVAHRGRARGGDGLLGVCELGRQLVFKRLALGFGHRVQLVAGLGADRLRLRAGGSKVAFIGLQSGLGRVLELLRLGEVA